MTQSRYKTEMLLVALTELHQLANMAQQRRNAQNGKKPYTSFL